MGHLFAYGTLMCDAIMAEVSESHLAHFSATLRGYRRVCVQGEHYPALIPDANRSVEGVVYENVPDSAWIRLDRFEGEMYSREIVKVSRKDGTSVTAETYVARAQFTDLLVDVEWDFAEFLSNNKENFRRSYRGYQLLK